MSIPVFGGSVYFNHIALRPDTQKKIKLSRGYSITSKMVFFVLSSHIELYCINKIIDYLLCVYVTIKNGRYIVMNINVAETTPDFENNEFE